MTHTTNTHTLANSYTRTNTPQNARTHTHTGHGGAAVKRFVRLLLLQLCQSLLLVFPVLLQAPRIRMCSAIRILLLTTLLMVYVCFHTCVSLCLCLCVCSCSVPASVRVRVSWVVVGGACVCVSECENCLILTKRCCTHMFIQLLK